MEREFAITYGLPDEDFWERYRGLWEHSVEQSPFKAPGILRSFAARTQGRLVRFTATVGGELRGAVIFKERGGDLTFLSDMKTDVNFFVLHQEDGPEEWSAFFRFILGTVKARRWTLTLNNQPVWARYRPAFEITERLSGLYWQHIPYSVCPYVEADSPQALFVKVHHVRELRYRASRLMNQLEATYEVLTDDHDLDVWVEAFAEAHVQRWKNTRTPSYLNARDGRVFLADCMRAWLADGLLLRFAVVVQGKRIAFVLALRHGDALIHHTTAYDQRFAKYSPGKALIHEMARWMAANGYRMLDFGDGREPYKYVVADQEHHLDRIFISGRAQLLFRGRTELIKFVRGHPRLHAFYQQRIKSMLGAR